MAEKSPANPEIERLIGRLAANRGEVAAEVARIRRSVRQRLDVRAHARESLRRHPWAWFGASVAAGALATGLIFRRRRPHAPEGGRRIWVKWLLGGLAAVAKPLLRDWVVRQTRRQFHHLHNT